MVRLSRDRRPDCLPWVMALVVTPDDVWGMDRGIPSEAIWRERREPERQTFYLVGTPRSGW